MDTPPSLEDLVRQAQNKFKQLFGVDASDCGYGAGRINLIGDHTDYNDGLVFPMAIPLYTVAVGGLSLDQKTEIASSAAGAGDEEPVLLSLENLVPGEPQCE